MTSNALDAGIGDLTIDSGLSSGALGGVTGGQYADLDARQLAIAGARKEVVFIEDNVPDIGTLLNGIGRDKQVVILDSKQDGLHQIAQALAGQSNVDAVHIISHGQAGAVDLGSLILNAGNLGAHQDDLQTIRSSMSPGGDILLYGCDIGAGSGAGFVQQLAIATGTDVAASNDLTGSAALGGDWNLEVSSGHIETPVVVNAQTAALYQQVLSLSNQTVGFSNDANFVTRPNSIDDGANADIVYKINGNSNYQLHIDGANTAVYVFSSPSAYLNIGGQTNPGQENKVTFSFVGGDLFTLSSLQATNFQNLPAYTSDPSLAQTLTFTGFDSQGHVVKSQTGFVPQQTGYTTLTLSGFSNIAKLTITTTENNGFLKFVALDNLVFDGVQAPPPAVTAVSASTANGAYKAGDVIHITVAFDQAVTVDTTGGTPQLQLETGATDHSAVYASGSGTSTLTFNYTVQAGDTSADLDYLSSAALTANGGTIKSSGGTDAALTLAAPGAIGSLGTNAAIVIDTTAPSAPSAPNLLAASDTGVSNSDHLTNNTTPTLTGTFADGDVTTVKFYDTDGVTQVGSGAVSGGSYSIALSPGLSEGSHTITAKVIDGAGNVSSASGSLTLTIDTTAPTVTLTSDSAALKIGDSSTITFTFSEDPGTSFTAGDISVSGGTLGPISGSGMTRSATFTPTQNVDNGTASIAVIDHSYTDAAGNNGSAAGPLHIAYDTLAPTLAISSSQSTLAAGQTATITFTFSEDPGTSFSWDGSAGDVTVSGGTLSAISGSGTTRTAIFTPDANVASGTASITVAAGTYQDAAGNGGGAGTTPSITYDTLAPNAPSTPTLDTIGDSGISNTDNITNHTSLPFTGNADPGANVKLYDTDGTTQIGSGTADAGGVWHITTTTLSPGTHTVTAVQTEGGNASTASAGTTVTIDTTPPTLAITSDHATLKAGDTAAITFTFSEDPGASFSAAGVSVSGGTLSAISGSGLTRSAVFTPNADVNGGSAGITVSAGAYTDAAGNDGAAAGSPTITYDTLPPTLTITSDKSALKAGDTAAITFTFSEDPGASFSTAGVSVSGGTLGPIGGSGLTRSATFTPTPGVDGGAASIGVSANAYTDAAGNGGAASTPLSIAYDTKAPTLTITSDHAVLAAGQTATITFSFSEDPGASFSWDGSVGDVVVSGGTLSALSGSGLTRTAIFTPDAGVDAGTASITVAAGAYADAAGNTGAAGATPTLQFDTLAPPAPAAPTLDAASDSGTLGDGITTHTSPVIDGSALANARVVLYDTIGGHTVQIGTATADASGHWSIAAAGLAYGTHALSATQLDAAGNASSASAALTLQIQAPPTPVTLIDGVAVDIEPVSLPGGAVGSAISIPIVSTARVESSGLAGVADIPILTTSHGDNLLLAQLSPGYGLSASGANVAGSSASDLLIAAIKAATPTHAADDQNHLSANGQSFLDGLAAGSSLLVETVKPVGSSTTPNVDLTLSGPASMPGQNTALVIDAGGLAAGNAIHLQGVNFAAVIGAADVVAQGGNTVLSGDAASQHFTVTAGGSGSVFAGAGDDVLSFDTSTTKTAPAAGVTLLHGGADKDVATFSGAESDYQLDYHNGYVIVSSKAAPNVQALVVNVEQLQFSDATVAIQDSSDMDTLAAMYQAVLGRQADMKGIEYWADSHQAGVSWGAIALSMVASNERVAAHGGFDGDASHDLTLLYNALFDRAPDAAGLAYWTDVMHHGASLEQVAGAMVQSTEMTGHQIAATGWNFSV